MRHYTLPCSTDGGLELVAPAPRYVEAMLTAGEHPGCFGESVSTWGRQQLHDLIAQTPAGFDFGNPWLGRWPAYVFWMHASPSENVPLSIVGTCSMRLGTDEQLTLYTGHIGYGVFPPARGRRFAERATRLLLPLAKLHGYPCVWITVNPDNAPSRITIERVGGRLIDVVDIPLNNPARHDGSTQKCRYRIDL